MKHKHVSGQLDFFSCVIFPTLKVEKVESEETPKELITVPLKEEKKREENKKFFDRITFSSNKKVQEKQKSALENLVLSGNEDKDRRLIQDALDRAGIDDTVSYDDRTVYPSKKLVKELKQMVKTNSIAKLSNRMYEFLHMHFTIAHYDKNCFIAYFDGKFTELWKQEMKYDCQRVANRYSDIAYIMQQAGVIK